jgi:hypothetical protein
MALVAPAATRAVLFVPLDHETHMLSTHQGDQQRLQNDNC